MCRWQKSSFYRRKLAMASFTALLLIFCSWFTVSSACLLYWIWLKPWRRRRSYQQQGIKGPAFRPVVGNHRERIDAVREMAPPNPVPLNQLTAQTVLPDLFFFCTNYGNVNVHEVLWTTILTVAEPALVKEVMVTKAAYYQKAAIIRTLILSVLGRGLVFSEGDFWRQQRKIYTPAFHKTFLKGLSHHMKQCCVELACRWRSKIEEQGGTHAEVEVSMDVSTITLDIIARSAFGASIPGSAPTSQGVLAFQNIVPLFTGNLRKLFTIIPLIPGYRFLPTADNRKNWERERFIDGMLDEIIEARLKAIQQQNDASTSSPAMEGLEHPYGQDLLGLMVAAWKGGSPTMSRKQILSECKTIFVAGHSTTALGITWALFLLAVHPEWQERLRLEIQELEGEAGDVSMDSFGKMVQMDMFMKEVYRLYPPVTIVYRQCKRSHQIGNIWVAAGTVLAIPIAMMHQSKEQWGQDADVFRPERWQEKNGGVKDPAAFCTFGAGPRQCLGREFALMETFTMLSTLLPQFHLSLAPCYRHAPGQMQSIRPVYGMQLQVRLRHPN